MDRYIEGIMTNIRVEKPAREVIEQIIGGGAPHHYSLIWADAAGELKEVCGLLGVQAIEA